MIDPEEAICELTAKLKSLLTKEFPYLRTERIAEYGDPAQLIIDLAHSSDVDLLTMPIHGYESFWAFLLGSVAAKVLHDAQCPVWTAVHLDGPPGRDHVTCRKILCAVGGAPKDTTAAIRLVSRPRSSVIASRMRTLSIVRAERVAPQSQTALWHTSSASPEIHSSLRNSSGVSPASRTIPAIV